MSDSNVVSFDTPDTFEKSKNRIEHPGKYHFHVSSVESRATDKDGKLIDAWVITANVLQGTARDPNGNCLEREKEIGIRLRNASSADSDGGKMAKSIQSQFLLAVKLLNQDDTGKRMSINLDDAVGRQFIAEFVERKWTDRKGDEQIGFDLKGANIWHIDDPAVQSVPKDEQALKLLPDTFRTIGAIAKPPKKAFSEQITPVSDAPAREGPSSESLTYESL